MMMFYNARLFYHTYLTVLPGSTISIRPTETN